MLVNWFCIFHDFNTTNTDTLIVAKGSYFFQSVKVPEVGLHVSTLRPESPHLFLPLAGPTIHYKDFSNIKSSS